MSSTRFWLQGLQAIGASSRTLLGPQRNVKAILNGNDPSSSRLFADTLSLVNVLDIEHPVGQLLLDVCNGQQKVCGNGCASLVSMADGWSRAVQTLTEQGIPLAVVLCLFEEALQICEETCQLRALKLHFCLEHCLSHSSDGLPPDMQLNDGFTDRLVSTVDKIQPCVVSGATVGGKETIDVNDTDWFFEGSSALEVKLDEKALEQSSSTPESATEVDMSVYDVLGITEFEGFVESSSNTTSSIASVLFQQSSTVSVPIDDSCFDTDCTPLNVISQNMCEMYESEDDFSFEEPPEIHPANPAASAAELCQIEPSRMGQEMAEHSLQNKPALDFGSRLVSLLKSKRLLQKPSQQRVRGSRHLASHETTTMRLDTNQKIQPVSSDVMLTADMKLAGVGSIEGLSGEYRDKAIVLNDWEAVEQLCSCLAHGMEFEMSMAREILHLQWMSGESQSPKLDMSCVFAISMVGPNTRHSQVVQGVVVRAQLNQEILRAHGQILPVLVVVGDVSPHFTHPGFKTSRNVTLVVEPGNRDAVAGTGQQAWLNKLEKVLKQTNVGVVTVQGHVDSTAVDVCSRLGVAIVSGLTSQQQTVLCDVTGATKLTYLHMAQPEHVGTFVKVSVYGGDGPLIPGPMTQRSKTFLRQPELPRGKCCVIIQCVKGMANTTNHPEKVTPSTASDLGKVGLATAIICGPSPDLVDMMERNFWKCVHRIKNSLSSGCVLPGGGCIELSCSNRLRCSSRDGQVEMKGIQYPWVTDQVQRLLAEFRPVVYSEFATALERHVGQTAVNMGWYDAVHSALACIHDDTISGEEQQVVYDDFRTKLEAWKRAGSLVKLLIQIGSIVSSKASFDQL